MLIALHKQDRTGPAFRALMAASLGGASVPTCHWGYPSHKLQLEPARHP